MTRRYVLLAAASIAMLAACSGSDGQARVTVTTPVTAITSAPDTTQPEPSPAPTPATIETVANTGTAPAPTTEPAPAPSAAARLRAAYRRGTAHARNAAWNPDPTF